MTEAGVPTWGGSDQAQSQDNPLDGSRSSTAMQAADAYNERALKLTGSPGEARPADRADASPGGLRYDARREAEIARKRMFASTWEAPTDFRKYFDIRTGTGPRQPLESPEARAERRVDEVKAWVHRLEEQDALSYNRRASARQRGE